MVWFIQRLHPALIVAASLPFASRCASARFLVLLACFLACSLHSLGFSKAYAQLEELTVSRIAFGSCADQQKPCPIWRAIAAYDPNVLLLLGDNIYADVQNGRVIASNPEHISQAYAQLAANPDFDNLRKKVKLFATWDDHDFGKNDAGAEWQHKEASASIFHDFFGTPNDSPRRSRPGIYHADIFGPVGKRVQFIMLDTRFFRSKLEQEESPRPGWRSRPYIPQTDPDATLLGEIQWSWLDEQLRQPAELRFLCSSIQVISDEHPFEMWANFPNERARLYQLIQDSHANGLIILSGDRHLGDISLDNSALSYPLFDITASGLNQAELDWRPIEANSKRVAGLQQGNHFGSIEIDWQAQDPVVSLQLRLENGEIGVQTKVPLSRLQSLSDDGELPEGVCGPGKALTMAEGSEVRLQFRVAGGRQFEDTGRLLLNSQENFRNVQNFTVLVNPSALAGKFQHATLDSFKGRSIRVTGKISVYREQKQVVVDSADQLEVVE